MNEVTEVRHEGAHRLFLRFADGASGTLDLAPHLNFSGVFAALRDPAVFAQARVDADLGAVTWPGGADLCPDVMHAWLTGLELPGEAVRRRADVAAE
jgi:hypothetical protein